MDHKRYSKAAFSGVQAHVWETKPSCIQILMLQQQQQKYTLNTGLNKNKHLLKNISESKNSAKFPKKLF